MRHRLEASAAVEPSSIASKTEARSPGEELMTPSTSVIAVF
jgi:hypothetical protein